MLLWGLLYLISAFAFDGNDRLKLQMEQGVEVSGWFYSFENGVLVVSGDNRFVSVPVSNIQAVECNDLPMPLDEFHGQIEMLVRQRIEEQANPPPHAPPFVVVGLSMLWAGSGHAVLGEWKEAKGYAVVEGVIIGTAIYNIYRRSSLGVLVSLGALDLLFKAYSAGEALYITRARRARLGLD